MSYPISEIFIDDGFEQYTVTSATKGASSSKSLKNLAKINIFVGANSSGKSRFMRLLANYNKIRFFPRLVSSDGSPTSFEEFAQIFDRSRRNLIAFLRERNTDFNNVGEKLTKLSIQPQVLEDAAIATDLISFFKSLEELNHVSSWNGSHPDATFLGKFRAMAKKPVHEAEQFQQQFAMPNVYKFKKLYFPTLRGLSRNDSD